MKTSLAKNTRAGNQTSVKKDSTFVKCALARGLSFKTTFGNILTLTPPLVITEMEMDRALDILEASLAEETA